MVDKQELIDKLKYPPTHDYILDGLKPKGILAERFEAIKKTAPDFFKGKRFLDVGCNKAFFSLYASQFCNEVVGIDIDDNNLGYEELWNELKKPNTEFIRTGFRDFIPKKRFDRIFIGNTHHYIFRECNGWDWIYKLAAITNNKGLVLIEGPVDMKCRDMFGCIPEEFREHFNYEEFIEVMNKFFSLKTKIPTGYLQGRYIMLFERKPDPMDNKFELSELPVVRMIIESHREKHRKKAFFTKDDLVCKVYFDTLDTDYFELKVNMSRMSPFSNGIVGVVYDKGKLVGWLEKKISGRFFQFGENQIELFKMHCQHQIFLSRNGYLDFDIATVNCAEEKGKIVIFDKNQVNLIKSLEPYLIKNYFTYLKRDFPKIGEEIVELIRNAMATKDSVKIENAYKKVLEILEEKMKISVIIPVYNQKEEYFKEAVKSILNQTIKPYEIIIIDDGSEPQIMDSPETFLAALPISITILRNEKNMGIGYSRKRGIDEATGDYIAFLSSDDVWDKDFLRIMIETSRQQPNKILYSSNYHMNAKGKIILKFESLSYNNHEDFCIACWEAAKRENMFVNFSTTFFPKKVFKKVQFDKDLRFGEDLDFLLRSMKHFEYYLVNKPLLYYRAEGNLTSKIMDKIPKQNIMIRKKCKEYWNG